MVKTPSNQATASGSRSSTRNSASKPDSRGTRAKGLGSGKKLSERTPTSVASSSKKRKALDDASPTVAKRSKVASTPSASKKKKVIVVEVEIEELPVIEPEEERMEDIAMEEEDQDIEIDPFDEVAVRKVIERTGTSPKKKKEKKVINGSPSPVEAVEEEESVVIKPTPAKRGKSAKKEVVKKTPMKQKVIKPVKSEVAPSIVNDSDSEGDEAVASQLLGSKLSATLSRSSRSAPALVSATLLHTPTKRGTSKSTPSAKKSLSKPSRTPTKSSTKSTRIAKASTSKAILLLEEEEEVEEDEDLEEAQNDELEEGSAVIEEEDDGEVGVEVDVEGFDDENEMEVDEDEEEIEKSVAEEEEGEAIDVEAQEQEEEEVLEIVEEEGEEEEEEEVISASPSKTKSKTSIPIARSPSLSSNSSSSSSSNESSESGSDSESENGDGLEVQKPNGDADESPRSSRDPSPSSNGSRATSEDPRGIRSSARARHLPVAQADINNMPLNLRSDLVGWHDENSPIKARTAAPKNSKSKSKSKSKSSKSSRVRTEPEHVTKYPSKMLQELIERMGQVISGNRLPEPELTEGGFDESKVENWPYVEQWKTWEKPLRYAMENVVRDGVGNCVIVLGPRGVGKSAMVNRGLNIINNVYGDGSFICVRLNGLVQTTDRQALRTIARQLKSQGFVEEGGDYGSNAATMSTLLKMLEPANDPTALADKPIIIILDEFDLFALHPRQSFLYCLLDIVQGNRRKAGMGVIGLSARTDCLSILEKRVRSRCQSQVYQMVYPNDLQKYLRHARSLLSADVLYWENESELHRKMAKEWNAEVKAFMKESKVKDYFERIWSLYGNNPAHLLAALSPMYLNLEWDTRFTDDPQWPPSLNEKIVDDLEDMDDEAAEVPGQFIPRLHLDLLPKADEGGKRTSLIRDCSILELNVCVAAKHLRDDHDNTINLEMLYDAYNAHVRRRILNISSRRISKAQFAFAFDHLREMEVFLPHSGKPSWFVSPSGGDTFKMYRFIPWASTVDDEIARRGSDAPTALVKWCKSWQN